MQQLIIPASSKILLLSVAASLAFLNPVQAEKASSSLEGQESTALPFEEGERLTYSIRWGIIRAGTAVMEVHPMLEIRGEKVHHFSLTVTTTPFVDNFYKVRDRIDGFARADLQGSVLYLMKKEEGKNLRDVRVRYDLSAGVAHYSNFGEEQEPVEIPPATLDPLSVVFAIRAQELKNGTEIELPISDGRRAAVGVAQVKKRERVRVPAGRYQATLIEPDMQDVGGVFDKSGDSPMQIWFSNDEQRVPVRISSRVAVGSFHAELISIEKIAPDERAAIAALRAGAE